MLVNMKINMDCTISQSTFIVVRNSHLLGLMYALTKPTTVSACIDLQSNVIVQNACASA